MCYLDANGVDMIDQWLCDLDDKVQAKIDQRLRHLRQQPRNLWIRPYFDTLSDLCAGLGELRVEVGNVQYRLLGFPSGQMEWTFVFGAIEKGGKFVPLDTCAIAQGRKAYVLAKKERAHECEFA
jgi:hypothetical protein